MEPFITMCKPTSHREQDHTEPWLIAASPKEVEHDGECGLSLIQLETGKLPGMVQDAWQCLVYRFHIGYSWLILSLHGLSCCEASSSRPADGKGGPRGLAMGSESLRRRKCTTKANLQGSLTLDSDWHSD